MKPHIKPADQIAYNAAVAIPDGELVELDGKQYRKDMFGYRISLRAKSGKYIDLRVGDERILRLRYSCQS